MSNPQQDEAKDATTATVDFRGHEFTIERNYDDWPVEFVEALEEGKTVGIVRGALGPSQWRRVRAMNLKMRDLADLADEIAVALGFGASGESQASAD